MTPHANLIAGDARALPLSDASVQCVVTSPPYWGLRDYGHETQIGLEAAVDCLGWATGTGCTDCYVCALRGVFREVWRVLRQDGVVFLNLGDSYASGAYSAGQSPGGGVQGAMWAGRPEAGRGDAATKWAGSSSPSRGARSRALRDGRHAGKHTAIAAMGPMTQPNRMPQPGLKPKDLAGVPWRVALALQADGWWLRQDIVWAKPNPMPESVRDRCTKSHEYVFVLTKSTSYFWDAEAIAEVATVRHADADGQTRNARSVWTMAPQPYRGAHFAVMPEALAERCILAGSMPGSTVLDPFAGSGTTVAMAVRHGRHGVGVEAKEEYLALARDRVTDELERAGHLMGPDVPAGRQVGLGL